MGLKKTNAARILETMGIAYEIFEVQVDESDLSAVHVAELLHTDPDTVFKTLVVRGDRSGIFMVCIPAAAELDLKKLAAASGNKHAEMVPLKEVFPLTGYVRGGCSPLGAKKKYPVLLDEHAILEEHIYVSAGHRGVQLRLKPDDLLKAAEASYAAVIRES
ncbi:MAG: Cys-tRNA(Pro) deacylase [Desulfovibrionaceae bacterium]|nr:Cys-tRNA(Pro) deacylase [Desulfovibrionaceae bacterium]